MELEVKDEIGLLIKSNVEKSKAETFKIGCFWLHRNSTGASNKVCNSIQKPEKVVLDADIPITCLKTSFRQICLILCNDALFLCLTDKVLSSNQFAITLFCSFRSICST